MQAGDKQVTVRRSEDGKILVTVSGPAKGQQERFVVETAFDATLVPHTRSFVYLLPSYDPVGGPESLADEQLAEVWGPDAGAEVRRLLDGKDLEALIERLLQLAETDDPASDSDLRLRAEETGAMRAAGHGKRVIHPALASRFKVEPSWTYEQLGTHLQSSAS
jgi:hypothetical protein